MNISATTINIPEDYPSIHIGLIFAVDGDIILWEYKFDFEYHEGLKAPWRSALAQGQGISVLLRAYSLTKNTIPRKVRNSQKQLREFQSLLIKNGVELEWPKI